MAIGLGVALIVFMLFTVISKQNRSEPEIIFSEFNAAVERGDVGEVVIQGNNIQANTRTASCLELLPPTIPSWSSHCAARM